MERVHNNAVSKAEIVINLLQSMVKFRVDIEAALHYSSNSHSFDNIVDMVVTGAAHFYPLEKSFILMEVQVFPNHRVYNTFLAGGDMTELLEANDWMMKNAIENKCKHATIMGRKGWERELKKFGWKHKYSVLYKDVPSVGEKI